MHDHEKCGIFPIIGCKCRLDVGTMGHRTYRSSELWVCRSYGSWELWAVENMGCRSYELSDSCVVEIMCRRNYGSSELWVIWSELCVVGLMGRRNCEPTPVHHGRNIVSMYHLYISAITEKHVSSYVPSQSLCVVACINRATYQWYTERYEFEFTGSQVVYDAVRHATLEYLWYKFDRNILCMFPRIPNLMSPVSKNEIRIVITLIDKRIGLRQSQ